VATALLLEEGIFVECAVECAGVCDTVSCAGEELLDRSCLCPAAYRSNAKLARVDRQVPNQYGVN